MTLDLCVPAYNEEEIIRRSLASIRETLNLMPGVIWRILVVDNCSTDGTGDAARSIGDSRIVVLRTEKKGKGHAIVTGARHSTADTFAFIDADLSADPRDIAVLLSQITDAHTDIAIGSRLLNREVVRRGRLRTASSRIFNFLRRRMLGIRVTDSQCGLKVMNSSVRDLVRICEEEGWFLDVELLARAERVGKIIREVPIHWVEERFSGRKSRLHVFRDGIKAIAAFMRIRRRLRLQ